MTRLLTFVERRRWLAALIIFFLAFALRAFLWFRSGPHLVFNQVEVVQTAMCFARNGFLGNPYVLPTGPTAHVTPAFPFLIGLMYKIAPDLETGEKLKNLLTIFIAALQFAFLPLLSRAARVGVLPGVAAGVIGAVMPLLYLECSGDFEAPLVGLTLIVAAIATFTFEEWRRKPVAAFLTGLVWGLTALVSAQLLICGAIYEVLRRFFMPAALPVRMRALALIAAGFIAGVLPWTVRNWIELGSPVISRDNAGLELYVSNNDDAAVTFSENLKRRDLIMHHPHSNPAEAQLVRQLGEVRYNERKRAEAMKWIETHTAKFESMAVRRFVDFWIDAGGGKLLTLYWRGILVFGLIGLWLARRVPEAKLLLFGVLLVVYPLPHYIVQASERYRYPLNPVLLLFTGFAAVWAAQRMWERRFSEQLRPRLTP